MENTIRSIVGRSDTTAKQSSPQGEYLQYKKKGRNEMTKDEIQVAIKNAHTRAEIEVVLEAVVEKLQDKKIGKKFRESLKLHEEILMEKLDNLDKDEIAKEAKMTLKEGQFITVSEHNKYKVDVTNIFKVVAVTDIEIVLQDLTEYIGLHIVLKVEEQKFPFIKCGKISFAGTIVEIMDELK